MMKKLASSKLEVIDTLAHLHVCAELENNVPGLKGLFKDYAKNQITDHQKLIWDQYQKAVKKVRKDMVDMLKRDGSDA